MKKMPATSTSSSVNGVLNQPPFNPPRSGTAGTSKSKSNGGFPYIRAGLRDAHAATAVSSSSSASSFSSASPTSPASPSFSPHHQQLAAALAEYNGTAAPAAGHPHSSSGASVQQQHVRMRSPSRSGGMGASAGVGMRPFPPERELAPFSTALSPRTRPRTLSSRSLSLRRSTPTASPRADERQLDGEELASAHRGTARKTVSSGNLAASADSVACRSSAEPDKVLSPAMTLSVSSGSYSPSGTRSPRGAAGSPSFGPAAAAANSSSVRATSPAAAASPAISPGAGRVAPWNLQDIQHEKTQQHGFDVIDYRVSALHPVVGPPTQMRIGDARGEPLGDAGAVVEEEEDGEGRVHLGCGRAEQEDKFTHKAADSHADVERLPSPPPPMPPPKSPRHVPRSTRALWVGTAAAAVPLPNLCLIPAAAAMEDSAENRGAEGENGAGAERSSAAVTAGEAHAVRGRRGSAASNDTIIEPKSSWSWQTNLPADESTPATAASEQHAAVARSAIFSVGNLHSSASLPHVHSHAQFSPALPASASASGSLRSTAFRSIDPQMSIDHPSSAAATGTLSRQSNNLPVHAFMSLGRPLYNRQLDERETFMIEGENFVISAPGISPVIGPDDNSSSRSAAEAAGAAATTTTAAEFNAYADGMRVIDGKKLDWAPERQRRRERTDHLAEEQAQLKADAKAPGFSKRFSRRLQGGNSSIAELATTVSRSSHDGVGVDMECQDADAVSNKSVGKSRRRQSFFGATAAAAVKGRRSSSPSNRAVRDASIEKVAFAKRVNRQSIACPGLQQTISSAYLLSAATSALSPADSGGSSSNPSGSYAIKPPTVLQLFEASNHIIFNDRGTGIKFGDLFKQQRALVFFLRHWWCPFCQQFAQSLKHIDLAPLKRAGLDIVIIGQGSWQVITSFKAVLGVPFPLYADPERNVYKSLGMTMRTNDPGPECAVPDYIKHGMTKATFTAIKKGLFNMQIGSPGDLKLLGGEFILGPGLQCSFTHRMVTVRGHLDAHRILAQTGIDMTAKGARDILDESSIADHVSISSRSVASSQGFYNAHEHPGRAERTRSLGRSKARITKLFGGGGRKNSAEAATDVEASDTGTEIDADDFLSLGRALSFDGQRAPGIAQSQTSSVPQSRRESQLWNPFSSGKPKGQRQGLEPPPMPENAAAISAAHASRVYASEQANGHSSEPSEQPEALEALENSASASEVPAPASARSISAVSADESVARGSEDGSVGGPSSFKELTAASLRPMSKRVWAGPQGMEHTPKQSGDEMPDNCARQTSNGSTRDGQSDLINTGDDEAAAVGCFTLSDVSRTPSQILDHSIFVQEAPADQQEQNSVLSPQSTPDVASAQHSPSLSLFNQNGRFGSVSSVKSFSAYQTEPNDPSSPHEERAAQPHSSNFKDLPPSPLVSPGFSVVASDSFLGDLDAVDGFSHRPVSLQAHMSLEDLYYKQPGEIFEENVNEDLEVAAAKEQSAAEEDGGDGSDHDGFERSQDEKDGNDNKKEQEQLEDGEVDDDQATIDAHGANQSRTGLVQAEYDSDEDDLDAIAPDEEECDNHRPLLGIGLGVSSMRPTLSPTPEDEEEEEEDDSGNEDEGARQQRGQQTPDTSPATSSVHSSPYNILGKPHGSGRLHLKAGSSLVRAPNENLGTFMEEEEEEEDDGLEEEVRRRRPWTA